MIFSRPNSLVYLTRAGLSFYAVGSTKEAVLAIPHDTINDLEVMNPDKLRQQIETFIAEQALRPTKAVIVLSEEVLFIKTVASEPVELAKEIKEFLEELPFEPTELVYTIMPGPNGVEQIVATNSALYLAIKNILEGKDWRIAMVVPKVGDTPNVENWRKILAAALALSKNNFLSH